MYKLIFIVLFFSINSFSQEFETTLHVYDKNGKHDSIIFGINHLATNGIDTQLGERQILTNEIDTNLFICLAARNWNFANYNSNNISPSIISKKNIVPIYIDNGISKLQRFYIFLFAKDTPVHFEWNRKVFDTTYKSTFIISSRPGGWFDVGDQPTYMIDTNYLEHIRFTRSFLHPIDTTLFHYPITHYVFYIGINELISSITSDILTKNKIYLYPNPFKDYIHIYSENKYAYKIVNQLGTEVAYGKLFVGTNELNLNEVTSGIYFIQLEGDINPKCFKLIK